MNGRARKIAEIAGWAWIIWWILVAVRGLAMDGILATALISVLMGIVGVPLIAWGRRRKRTSA